MSQFMKAVVLKTFGDIDRCQLVLDDQYTLPALQDKFVRVRVKAVAFNPVDYKIRLGAFGGDLPMILGADFSGIIEDLGTGSTAFKIGDEVYGMAFGPTKVQGACAEFIDVSEDVIALKPKSLNFEESAALPIVGLTALQVFERAAIQKHESVLIIGASGGVGSMLTPMIRYVGAKIIATAGTQESAQLLHQTHGIPLDNIVVYQGLSMDQIRDKVIAANENKNVNVAIDLFGGEIKRVCVESLGLYGRFLTIVEEPDPNSKAIAFYPSQNFKNLFGISGTYHLVFVGAVSFSAPENWIIIQKNLNQLSTWIEDGKVKAPHLEVIGTMSVETVLKAHKLLESHRSYRKLVMKI